MGLLSNTDHILFGPRGQKPVRFRGGLLCGCLLAGSFVAPPAALAIGSGDCELFDLMPAFWKSLETDDAAVRIRASVIDPHPELYNPNYVAVPSGRDWDKTVSRERAFVEAHRREVKGVETYLVENVPRLMREFQARFPDYRCDFPFYIAPSFGGMDGAAAFIGGKHRIIFAPDVIPRFHNLEELRVLIDHETFHIYHHQATGTFGATNEAVPTIFAALWGEGLATFVSWRMNPDVDLDTALLQRGIPDAAKARLPAIARELLAHLDEKDLPTFNHYFVAGTQPPGFPPRAGYYAGVLLAQEFATHLTLGQMAHLTGESFHSEVKKVLTNWAGSRNVAAQVPR
jgi:hypothetical protein